MNIFEFLGSPSSLRKDNKIFQYVKHFDDVNPLADKGLYHKNVSFPMYAQVKRDGVFAALVILNGKAAVFNRTGKRMTNCTKVEEYFEECNTPDGVYLGEMLSRDCSLEQLSGVVNPNRTKPLTDDKQICIRNNLHIDFFDHVTIYEFTRGHTEKGFIERYNNLCNLMCSRATILDLQVIESYDDVIWFSQLCINNEEEGAVFKQDVEWLSGAKDWHQMKVVRGIHVDLECIGWEEGTGKYSGHVANLLFRYKNGKVVKAMLGKGWTHKDAEQMYKACYLVENGLCEDNALHPVGKVFHVYGLQESSKGVIRLPKVSELRHDKSEPDY